MKKIISGLIFALAFAAMSFGTGASAAPLGGAQTSVGAGVGSAVVHVGYCRELRLACEHKRELGEEGAGNCRRYREQCGGEDHWSHCSRLRYECLHKHENGREGEGLCSRYRYECRGGRSSW